MSTLPPELKGKKVSDTFMEYVEPYLTSLMNESPDRTLKEIEMALRIPWCIWNAIVHQKKKRMRALITCEASSYLPKICQFKPNK